MLMDIAAKSAGADRAVDAGSKLSPEDVVQEGQGRNRRQGLAVCPGAVEGARVRSDVSRGASRSLARR